MKVRRYFICLLAAGILLYFSLPNLPIQDGSLGLTFTIAWLSLCVFVIAGNLAAILFVPKNKGKKGTFTRSPKRKIRYYQ